MQCLCRNPRAAQDALHFFMNDFFFVHFVGFLLSCFMHFVDFFLSLHFTVGGL